MQDTMQDTIQAAMQGDSEAFIQLMEHYQPELYRAAYAILHNDADAADAMQETILLCWQKLHTLKNPAYCKTWVTRVLINCCKQMLRKNRGIVYVDSYDGIEPSVEEPAYTRDSLLQKVDSRYGIILSLYYKGGYSVREIAQMLHMNENTVKTRLARGRKACRKVFEAEQCTTEQLTGGI